MDKPVQSLVKGKTMKTHIKRKGVLTIEAALLIPMILFLFMLFLDMVYLTYVKTSAKSKLELSILDSKEKLSELKNENFNNLETCSSSIDEYINNKLKRSIFDELNLKVNKNSFTKNAGKQLKPAMQNKRNWQNDITSSSDATLKNYSFVMNYQLHFASFLSSFYEANNLKNNRLKGRIKFKEHRIFDEIISIDTIYDFIKNGKTAGKLASDFKKAIDKAK